MKLVCKIDIKIADLYQILEPVVKETGTKCMLDSVHYTTKLNKERRSQSSFSIVSQTHHSRPPKPIHAAQISPKPGNMNGVAERPSNIQPSVIKTSRPSERCARFNLSNGEFAALRPVFPRVLSAVRFIPRRRKRKNRCGSWARRTCCFALWWRQIFYHQRVRPQTASVHPPRAPPEDGRHAPWESHWSEFHRPQSTSTETSGAT
ncbi:hypothetical protein AVEN_94681-1 [Araneus ventricosus]|uniref:Uncharacterized protein n=1 Tax=Araneus ventricosus TaxID=182803 RepID=A0A4Y2I6J2_ARAVE|nr:hypothetical protein AVEN_94681-1 [Araneus ventricosus]